MYHKFPSICLESCKGDSYQFTVVGHGEPLIYPFIAFWDRRTSASLEGFCSQLIHFCLQQRYRNFELNSTRHVCQLNYTGDVLISDVHLQRESPSNLSHFTGVIQDLKLTE